MANEGTGNILADRGKAAAARFLERRGYKVLERDWCCEHGAVDLIALDDDTYVFAKVTTCLADDGMCESGLTQADRTCYERVAASYLLTVDAADCVVRFDRIDILVVAADRALIRHNLNAHAAREDDRDVRNEADGDHGVPDQPDTGLVTELARAYLVKEGYEVIDAAFCPDGHEAGFSYVARDADETLVFVVVGAEEGLGDADLDRYETEALICSWLSKHPEQAEAEVRVDLLAVSVDGSKCALRHAKDVLGLAA